MKSSLALIILATFVLPACSTQPKMAATPASVQEKAAASDQVPAPAGASPVSQVDANSNGLAGQLRAMQTKGVYFDFDQFIVKPEYREVIQQQAEFMKAHGNIVVTLQGNADERGSSEYNLALGDKRANAVRRSLEVMGIPDDRIKTVSLGEGHPKLACHEERCWQENRRADFIGKAGP